MLGRFAIAALVSCTGCGHAAPTGAETGTSHPAPADAPRADATPPGLADNPTELATRAVAMYQAIATLLAEPSTDCAAIATRLNAIETANDDVVKATAKVLHAGHDQVAKLRAAIEIHQAEMDAAAKSIAAAAPVKTCAADPTFAAAIDHLLGEP